MRVADLSPLAVRGTCVVLGLLFGVASGVVTDVTARRANVAPLVTGSPRARRNLALVVLHALLGLGLATVALRHPDTDIVTIGFWLATNLVVGMCFLAGAATDVEHMIIPNELSFGAALLALATAHFRPIGIVQALVGAVLGLAASLLPALFFKWVKKQSGMGLGDAKISIAAGAWLGIGGVFFMLMVGALLSVVAGVVMRVLGLRYRVPESVHREIAELRARAAKGDEDAKSELADDPMANEEGEGVLATRLPLGPFLVVAAFVYLFVGRVVVEAFFAL